MNSFFTRYTKEILLAATTFFCALHSQALGMENIKKNEKILPLKRIQKIGPNTQLGDRGNLNLSLTMAKKHINALETLRDDRDRLLSDNDKKKITERINDINTRILEIASETENNFKNAFVKNESLRQYIVRTPNESTFDLTATAEKLLKAEKIILAQDAIFLRDVFHYSVALGEVEPLIEKSTTTPASSNLPHHIATTHDPVEITVEVEGDDGDDEENILTKTLAYPTACILPGLSPKQQAGISALLLAAAGVAAYKLWPKKQIKIEETLSSEEEIESPNN